MPDLPEIPSTPEELVTAAKRLRFEASVLAAQAAGKLNQAEAYEALAGVKERGLTGTYPEGTVDRTQMQASSPSAGANISAAKSKDRLPFQRALIKRNLSLPEWARAQRRPAVEVETAKSWVKRSAKGARKVPRSWADRIAIEFVDDNGRSEVPATLASWPNGIDEDK